MNLNKDGTLSLPALTLTAQQLDDLLKELALARALMRPAIAADYLIGVGSVPLVQTDPEFAVSMDARGFVTVCLRHRGFGWLVFALPPERAAELSAFISKRTP